MDRLAIALSVIGSLGDTEAVVLWGPYSRGEPCSRHGWCLKFAVVYREQLDSKTRRARAQHLEKALEEAGVGACNVSCWPASDLGSREFPVDSDLGEIFHQGSVLTGRLPRAPVDAYLDELLH